MAVVVSSFGALTAMASPGPVVSGVAASGPFYDGFRRSYAQIYRTQPAVRTVVDFFARNVAQIGLHGFRRVGDTDRVRLDARHLLVQTLERPNPRTTRYRMIESTVQDIGIYENAYWLKLRDPRRLGLVRLPAAEMTVTGVLVPTLYTWTSRTGGQPKDFAPSEIVHFRGFDPANGAMGFPRLETLRRVLAEEAAASDYRRHFWGNAARVESVITRPAGAKWDNEKRDEFRRQWQEFAGKRAGMTPVLEDGMDLKLIGQSFKDSEYIGGRKLTREEVAAAYHVPLPMVGILDHATFSNIREQHKQLYQDCLGPWLTMLAEELELQLVPEFDDVDDVYLEFNIAEKMRGSFEEQAAVLAQAVGRPFMRVNEARARLNLPRDPDPKSDVIAEVAQGQARPSSSTPQPDAAAPALRAVFERLAARQEARLAKCDDEAARAAVAQHPRWTRELAADIRDACGADYQSWGRDADRIAAIVTGQTWQLIEDGGAPWSAARIASLVDEFAEVSRA